MTIDEVRRATTDAFVQRGADRRCLELLDAEQFKRFAEMVVAFDGEGRQLTWTRGLAL